MRKVLSQNSLRRIIASEPKAIELLKKRLSGFETEEGRFKGLNLKPRPDDIFIVATPKAGTTWVQQICPRFWGWVAGTGTPLGMLAEMLAAGFNSNVWGGNVAGYVEVQVLNWLKEIFGFPTTASGLLVSGGSMANLLGLTVARNARAGFDVRRHGLLAAPKRLRFYGSSEIHSSIQKAVELLEYLHHEIRCK